MGINADRAESVRRLANDYDCIDIGFVAQQLGCGRGQAGRAIRQARHEAAENGERWSYATGANGYMVAYEGDDVDRIRSYTTRLKSIASQRQNAGRVMSASVDHGRSSRLERAVGQMALADQVQAEADLIRLAAFQGLLS